MKSLEERNKELVKKWEWTWNNDVMRMVAVSYTHLTLPTKRIV